MQLPLLNEIKTLAARWKSVLDPVLANPLNSVLIIEAQLINGETVINHRLGRMQQGWIILDVDADAVIYRSAPLNNRTLTLTSTTFTNVSIGVF